MKKTKTYTWVYFPAEVIKQASLAVERIGAQNSEIKKRNFILEVDKGSETWWHDDESEFYTDYRNTFTKAYFEKRINDIELIVADYKKFVQISVTANERANIHEIFEIFEINLDKARLPKPPKPPLTKPTVFIGHGHSPLWRDLKDHLHEKHGYQIVAYETGARAGYTIRQVLDQMLKASTFACLIMTGEDQMATGALRARDNVVHEIGLYQGSIGFNRAIVLVEEGAEEFSNLQGTNQIRFTPGNIKETFGEVLATIEREFPREDK